MEKHFDPRSMFGMLYRVMKKTKELMNAAHADRIAVIF